MTYGKFTILVFVIVIASLGAIECAYRFITLCRDFTAWTVAVAERTYERKYDTLLFGDSVTSLTFYGISLDETVLNLSTTAPVAIPGNYFLLRRYLERNQPPKRIIFFVSQMLLFSDIRSSEEKSQFSRVFDRFGEVAAMTMAGRWDVYSIGQLAEKRQYFLKQLLGFVPIYSGPPSNTSWDQIRISAQDTLFDRNAVASSSQNYIVMEMPEITHRYLESFIDLCKMQRIELTFVVEPANPSYKNAWKWSKARPKLEKLAYKAGIKIIDINQFQDFPDSAFRSDAVHLREGWTTIYIHAIQAHVANLLRGTVLVLPGMPLEPRYKATLSEGINFNKNGYPDFISNVQGISIGEASGRWTDGSQTVIEFVKPLPEKFILKISAGAVPYWQDKPIRIIIGTTKSEAKFGKPGSWTVPTDVAIPVTTDGNARSIIFEFPDAKSPQELGIAPESRKLVLFLSSIRIDP